MKKITDRVQSFEDACAIDGVDPVAAIPFAEPKTDDQIAINGFAQALIITRVYNEGWVPNYDDMSEEKFEIIWILRSEAAGGPGFSYNGYGSGYSISLVGARLVFKSRELAKDAAQKFPEIYKKFIDVPRG